MTHKIFRLIEVIELAIMEESADCELTTLQAIHIDFPTTQLAMSNGNKKYSFILI